MAIAVTLTVNLTFPLGGEEFDLGETINITWQSVNAITTDVLLSSDGGVTFAPLASGLAGSVTSFAWTPAAAIASGYIRIVAHDGGFTASSTDATPFSVVKVRTIGLSLVADPVLRNEIFQAPLSQTPLKLKVVSGTLRRTLPVTLKLSGAPVVNFPLFSTRFTSIAEPRPMPAVGNLFTANSTLFPSLTAGVTESLDPGTDGMPSLRLRDLTLAANVQELIGTGAVTGLVPVDGTTVTFNVQVTTTDPRVILSPSTLPVRLTVSEPETYEEYYRVSFARAGALNPNLPLDGFPKAFAAALPSQTLTTLLSFVKQQGRQLFQLAVAAAPLPGNAEDASGILYTVRLQAAVSLKKFAASLGAGASTIAQLTSAFELASRGLDRIQFPATTAKKVLLFGFDPFNLAAGTGRGNSSGSAALAFHNHSATTPLGVGYTVQAAILPVRFADFSARIVENAVSPHLAEVDLVLSTSLGARDAYDLERFAGKNRSFPGPDNNNSFGNGGPGQVLPPPDLASTAPQFIETALPAAAVVTAPTLTLNGPDGATPFVLNQRFSATESTGRVDRTFSQPGTPDAFVRIPIVPSSDPTKNPPTGTSINGSGGGYLSNELFYRLSLLRMQSRPSLAQGHLHVPSTGDSTFLKAVRDAVAASVQEVFARLVQALATFAGELPRVEFASGIAGTQPVTLTNKGTQAVTIAAITTPASPFSLTAVAALPLTVQPGASAMLFNIAYAPLGTVGPVAAAILLNGTRGELLFRVDATASRG